MKQYYRSVCLVLFQECQFRIFADHQSGHDDLLSSQEALKGWLSCQEWEEAEADTDSVALFCYLHT